MDVNSRFQDEIPNVLLAYPSLSAKKTGDINILSGPITIYTEDKVEIDTYEIEIHPSEKYPDQYPFVYEVGGKLPHNIDWHIYTDGHWCIGVAVEEAMNCSQGISLVEFISKQIVPFLFNQTYRRINGFFYRERSHGIVGVLEYYKETLRLTNYTQIYAALSAVYRDPKCNSKCFCSSRKKYQKCHRTVIRYMRKNAYAVILRDFKTLEKILLK